MKTKHILISGSSSGIGRAITEKLLAENYSVIGLARDHKKFSPKSPHYYPHAIDFADIETLEKQLRVIQKKYITIDSIICCAGFGEFCELEQFSIRNMQRIINVNFLSQAILVKSLLPDFKKRRSGKIIFLGSECALEGQKKASLYSATKFALRGFAQSLRKECASAHIAITLINPGVVATPFFDSLAFQPAEGFEHAVQPEQIATLITTLLPLEHNCVVEEINLQPMKNAIQKK